MSSLPSVSLWLTTYLGKQALVKFGFGELNIRMFHNDLFGYFIFMHKISLKWKYFMLKNNFQFSHIIIILATSEYGASLAVGTGTEHNAPIYQMAIYRHKFMDHHIKFIAHYAINVGPICRPGYWAVICLWTPVFATRKPNTHTLRFQRTAMESGR